LEQPYGIFEIFQIGKRSLEHHSVIYLLGGGGATWSFRKGARRSLLKIGISCGEDQVRAYRQT
jgi:hypothetical protein